MQDASSAIRRGTSGWTVQGHPKHKLALAAVQNQRNRQTEFETKKLGSTEYGTANEDSEGGNASL